MKYQINFILIFLALIQALNICGAWSSSKHRSLVQDGTPHDIHLNPLQQKRFTSSRSINFGNQGRQRVKDVSARGFSNSARSIVANGQTGSKLTDANNVGQTGSKAIKAERSETSQNINKFRSLGNINLTGSDRMKRSNSSQQSGSGSNLNLNLGPNPIIIGDENGSQSIEVALQRDLDRRDDNNPFFMDDARHSVKPSNLFSSLKNIVGEKKPIVGKPIASIEIDGKKDVKQEVKDIEIKEEDVELDEKVDVGEKDAVLEESAVEHEGKFLEQVEKVDEEEEVGIKFGINVPETLPQVGGIVSLLGDKSPKVDGLVKGDSSVETLIGETGVVGIKADESKSSGEVLDIVENKVKDVVTKSEDETVKVGGKLGGGIEKVGLTDALIKVEDEVKKVEGEGEVKDVTEKVEAKKEESIEVVEEEVDVVEKVEVKKPIKKGGKKKIPRPRIPIPVNNPLPQPLPYQPSYNYNYDYQNSKPVRYNNLPQKCLVVLKELEGKMLGLLNLMEKLKFKITLNPLTFSSHQFRELLHQIALIRAAAEETLIALKMRNLRVIGESDRLVILELNRLSSSSEALKLEPRLPAIVNNLQRGYNIDRKACKSSY